MRAWASYGATKSDTGTAHCFSAADSLLFPHMKIVLDQDACIGAASCVVIAAKTYALNEEGKVFLVNESATYHKRNAAGEVIESESTSGMDLREIIIEGARSCPVLAIKLFEDDGTEIEL